LLEMNGEKNTTNKGETGIVVDVHKYRLDKAFKHTHVRKCTQKKHGARCKTDLTGLVLYSQDGTQPLCGR
jgi:hypothetical protein